MTGARYGRSEPETDMMNDYYKTTDPNWEWLLRCVRFLTDFKVGGIT